MARGGRSRTSQAKTLMPTMPNAGIEAAYRKTLDVMITHMMEQARKDAIAQYRGAQKGLAQDEATRPYFEEFDEEAERIAAEFVGKANRHTRASLVNALKNAGYTPGDLRSLRRKPQDLDRIIQAIIEENALLIRSIPVETTQKIEKLVNESIQRNRDLGALVSELEQTKELRKLYEGLDDIDKLTKRRARTIARDQNNKVTEMISMVRVQSLGVTEGYWMHRGGGKVPRKSHRDKAASGGMNGARFKLSEGLYDPEVGRNIIPGELVNCHCTYRPILPDLE